MGIFIFKTQFDHLYLGHFRYIFSQEILFYVLIYSWDIINIHPRTFPFYFFLFLMSIFFSLFPQPSSQLYLGIFFLFFINKFPAICEYFFLYFHNQVPSYIWGIFFLFFINKFPAICEYFSLFPQSSSQLYMGIFFFIPALCFQFVLQKRYAKMCNSFFYYGCIFIANFAQTV